MKDRQLWESSAAGWIEDQGERGDWLRRNVLDPALEPLLPRPGSLILDVGCGEGRNCRLLAARGERAIGLDPTTAFVEHALSQQSGGSFVRGVAEALPFASGRFDAVLSLLALLDIADFEQATREMVRVLRPGGKLIVALLTPYITCFPEPWHMGPDGEKQHMKLDRYLEARAQTVAWNKVEVTNYHRPLGDYMGCFLANGLVLEHFDEPVPVADADRRDEYLRAPWLTLMVWRAEKSVGVW